MFYNTKIEPFHLNAKQAYLFIYLKGFFLIQVKHMSHFTDFLSA